MSDIISNQHFSKNTVNQEVNNIKVGKHVDEIEEGEITLKNKVIPNTNSKTCISENADYSTYPDNSFIENQNSKSLYNDSSNINKESKTYFKFSSLNQEKNKVNEEQERQVKLIIIKKYFLLYYLKLRIFLY